MDRYWRQQAACRDSDPELFFPIASTGHQEAAAVCARCPVVDACLGEALRVVDVYGYRGGKTGDERARMARARNRRAAPKPTPVERVLQLAASGNNSAQIASQLGLHVDRVRRVLRKAKETAA